MKTLAKVYSLALGVVSMWAWISYFLYEKSTREHLLPGIALNALSLPSSLVIEKIAEQSPWLLNTPIAMLAFVTMLGGIQAVLLWLLASRFKLSTA